jgi:hypothetical protein
MSGHCKPEPQREQYGWSAIELDYAHDESPRCIRITELWIFFGCQTLGLRGNDEPHAPPSVLTFGATAGPVP